MAASSQFDIVARLQLRAEQFSSEGGRSFADLATKAKSSAAGIRDSFGQSFAEVQKLASQSLQMPRTARGSLDLSAEINQLQQQQLAAEQSAIANRELAVSFAAAAPKAGDMAEKLRLQGDAAAVAALNDEKHAAALRDELAAMKLVQGELDRTASATTGAARAANDNAVATGAQKAGYQQLGYQLNDIAVSLQGGISPMTVFTQQGGQLFQALGLIAAGSGKAGGAVEQSAESAAAAGVDVEGMGEKVLGAAEKAEGFSGKLGKVAGFLAGPWGAAVTIGLAVLSPLVSKLFESNDALGDAVEKLKKDAEQTEATAKAKEAFAKTEEGVTAAIREQNKAFQEADTAQRSAAEQANIDAKRNLQREISIRRVTLAMLEQAKVLAENAGGVSGPGGADSLVKAQYDAQVERLQKKAEEQQALIDQAQQNVQLSRQDLIAENAKRAADPMAMLNKLYDDRIAAIRTETAEAIKNGRVVGAASQRRINAIEAERKAAQKTLQEQQSAANRKPGRDAELATPSSIAKLLRDSLGGVNVTATTNGKHVAGSDHYRGAAIDFVPKGGMGSITKDQIRDAFQKAGVSIRRNAGGVEQLFGPGDKGHSDHFHVAWEKGKLAVDNYRSSVRETNKASHDAEEAQKKLEASFEQIVGEFDPAADAARKYREEIEAIALLAANRKITREQQFDYMAAAKRDYTAAQSTNSEQLLRDTFGDAQVTAALADFDRGVAAGVEVLANGVDDAATSFGDGLRDAVGSAMDLLGIRINGPLGGQLRGLLQPGGIEGQANDIAKSLTDGLRNSKLGISPESIDKISSTIGSAVAGASYGQLGGSVFASITGGKQSQLGSALGGVAGKVAGDALGKTIASTVGGTLGKTLGGAAGPLGAIAGGIVGSVIGGLFKKTVKGSAGISTGDGTISAGSASGTNATVKGQAGTLAGSVASGLQSIADQLGAVISGSSNVQIGVYKDKLRVSTNGTPIGGKGSVGAQTFTDETAAIKYAIQDALQDGVLSGISAASLKILKSGQDLERALSKALMIEAVPKDLKAMLDPVGAAIDELNAKFKKTVDALKEGGASAEQMAQAQQLYDIQLAQVKNSTASASATLKDFLTSLKIGSNSPYSLRDQEQSAKSALAPFLAQIAAGQSIDQGKYQAAAQAYLDIERQLYGSTKAYFDALDAVQAATNKAISSIDNAKPIGTSTESPFAKATAASAATTASNTQTTNELLDQISQQTALNNELLMRLAIATGNGIDSFIGTGRSFVAAA